MAENIRILLSLDTEGFQKGINKALASSKRVKDIAKQLDISTSNVRAALSRAGAVRGGTDQLKNIKQQQFFLRELRKEAGLDVAALRQLDNALLKVRQSLRTEGLRLRIGNNAFAERQRLQGLVGESFNPDIARRRLRVLAGQGGRVAKIDNAQFLAGMREIDQKIAATQGGLSGLIGRLGVLKTVFIGIISARLLGFFFELGNSIFQLNKNITQALATFGQLDAVSKRRLAATALAAGLNLSFSASSVEAAAALEQLARDGNTANQAILKLAPTLQFAEAISLEFADAANKIGDVSEALGLTTQGYIKSLDDIALGQRLGTATGEELLDALLRVAPQARAANVEFRELLATLVTLGNRGNKGVRAGENLGRAIVVAQESFIRNRAAFAREGITVFDADRGGAVGLLKLIRELEVSLEGLTPEGRFAKLSSLFDDKRNVKFILTLINASQSLADNLKRIENEANGEAARQAFDRMTGFERLGKVILGSFQTLGQSVAGVFNSILKSLLPAENAAQSFTVRVVKLTAAIVAGAAAAGAVILVIKAATLAIASINTAVAAFGLFGFAAFSLVNPVTWAAIAAGVAAATVAFVALNRELKKFPSIDVEKNLQGISDQVAVATITAQNARITQLEELRNKLLSQSRGQNRGQLADLGFKKQVIELQKEIGVFGNEQSKLSKVLSSKEEGFTGTVETRIKGIVSIIDIAIQKITNVDIALARSNGLINQQKSRLDKLLEGGINFTKLDEASLQKSVDSLFKNLKTPSETLQEDLDLIKEIVASQKLLGLFPEFTQAKLNQATQAAFKKFEDAAQKQLVTVNAPAATFGSAAGFRTRFEIRRALEEDVNTPILQSQVDWLKSIDKNGASQIKFLQTMSEFFNAETARAFAALNDPAGATDLILKATFAGL